MIDATVDGDDVGSTKLSSEQIASLSIDFLLAGYETTANTLAYTTYLLAMNPDVQEKLQAEIDQYFEDDPVSNLILLFECLPMKHRINLCMRPLWKSIIWTWW